MKRNQKRISCICLLVFCMCMNLLLAKADSSGAEKQKLELSDFYDGDVFLYQQTPWESSKEEVESLLSISLKEAADEANEDGIQVYLVENNPELYEKTGTLRFLFDDLGLNKIEVEFQEESLNAYADSLLEQITDQCGEYDKQELYPATDWNLKLYQWTHIQEEEMRENSFRLLAYYQTNGQVDKVVLSVSYYPCKLFAQTSD